MPHLLRFVVLQVIEVPIIAGLFGATIPRVTWYSAAAAVLGVGLLESAGGNSTFVSCHIITSIAGVSRQDLFLVPGAMRLLNKDARESTERNERERQLNLMQ